MEDVMLYPEKMKPERKEELFCRPTCEYRGTPFWAWNGKLEKETLLEQIEILKKMGMGGFHMHVRTGMDTPYLSDAFMEHIRTCIEKAKEEGMLAWLYDEDRWPSGTAGGQVTREHPEYASRNLLLTTKPYADGEKKESGKSEAGHGRGGIRQENGELLAVYDVERKEDGTLCRWKRVGKEESKPDGAVRWYAYLEHGTADPWFNDAPYADTLCPEAVRAFTEITHDAYRKQFSKEFGRTVPAIFTDEPQFNVKSTLSFAGEEKDVFLPWTVGFAEEFEKKYGQDILDGIPELLWELPDGAVSVLRYRYHNEIADRFAKSYCKQVGDWCRENGLALTGHVMGEGSLREQTEAIGDAMRCYRYFDIPGIDMLCDRHEYTTAKQAQSMVHQMGAEGMLSELYGVTGWDCDFRTYKLQGDWQAALGVTVRVPHLAWMTMKGEAKRDYPASISFQSPWYDQFSMIEDHFARLNTVLTRGTPQVKIAVVHPIESYWLYWGPAEQTAAEREYLEREFHELAETLLFHGIDFDYLSENELPHLCKEGGFPLSVGSMCYEAVVVCGCRTLRSSTIERLLRFMEEGGTVFLIGESPRYVDAVPDRDRLQALVDGAVRIERTEAAILQMLKPYQLLDIRREDGSREDRLLHQVRKDGEVLWIFLAVGKNPESPDVDDAKQLQISIKGTWKLTAYDTMTGMISHLEASYRDGCTILKKTWYLHDSLLLCLEQGKCESGKSLLCAQPEHPDLVFGTVCAELTEPNMLLLDMAEYAVDGGEYLPEEELLRVDNIVRKELGLPLRRKEVTQPYLVREERAEHRISLRFAIPAECEVPHAELALEDAEQTELIWNGVKIEKRITGWFVDPCIQKVALPPLAAGRNVLEVRVPVGARTNLENFYLLGDFGVRVNGTEKTVTAPVRNLGFSDIVPQGLPFYTGNVLYRFRVVTDGNLKIRVPRYRGGLVKVFADGKDMGNIAFSPYEADLSSLMPGEHEIGLLLYGTRQNGFGQLHHTPGIWYYQSPNSFRSEGTRWCYEYQFREAGILRSPEIYGGYVLREDGTTRKAVIGKASGIREIDAG